MLRPPPGGSSQVHDDRASKQIVDDVFLLGITGLHPRLIQTELVRASRNFPAMILTGPRRAGKTTLLRRLFPKASYYLLEDPDVISRLRSDPRSFIDEIELPVVLDEIQNVPEILNYVRTRIDHSPKKMGQWFLTGSQEAPLMKGVTESMAGRAAILAA